MKRIVHVVVETFQSDAEHSIIVSHGNIITLLLKYYNNEVDFQVWENLSNPDIFQCSTKHNEITIERVWK